MVKLANGLAQGYPGVRPELAQLLVDRLNQADTARSHARLGRPGGSFANADLATGCSATSSSGRAKPRARRQRRVLDRAAALAVADSETLLDALDVAGALDLEAFAANLSIRSRGGGRAPYPGSADARASARAARRQLPLGRATAKPAGSADVSARCLRSTAPRATRSPTRGSPRGELNAHQGNPLVIASVGRVVAAGNFDIVPLAAALDFLRIALAPALTSAAERALKLLQSPLTGLPSGLAAAAAPRRTRLASSVRRCRGSSRRRALAQPVSYEIASRRSRGHRGPHDHGSARRAQACGDGAPGRSALAIELSSPPRPSICGISYARRGNCSCVRARPRARSVHGTRARPSRPTSSRSSSWRVRLT